MNGNARKQPFDTIFCITCIPQPNSSLPVALTDAFVAVLMGAAGVLGVIDMHGAQALDTHHTIELVKHTVKIVNDVIAGVIHMAGVQANAQLGRQLGALVGQRPR